MPDKKVDSLVIWEENHVSSHWSWDIHFETGDLVLGRATTYGTYRHGFIFLKYLQGNSIWGVCNIFSCIWCWERIFSKLGSLQVNIWRAHIATTHSCSLNICKEFVSVRLLSWYQERLIVFTYFGLDLGRHSAYRHASSFIINSSPLGKKWSPLRKLYFQIHFREWKFLYFGFHWKLFPGIQLSINQHLLRE